MCCLRIGPCNDVNCERLCSLSGTFLPWTKRSTGQLLGIYLVSSKRFKICTEHSRRSYRAADTIFGRIGRIATEEVVLHLLLTKCVAILLYGLEACSIRKTDLDSLDFIVNRFFMKLFHTNNTDTVKECQMFFCFEMPSTLLKKRVKKSPEYCVSNCK